MTLSQLRTNQSLLLSISQTIVTDICQFLTTRDQHLALLVSGLWRGCTQNTSSVLQCVMGKGDPQIRRRGRRKRAPKPSSAVSIDDQLSQLTRELQPEINAQVHKPDSQSIRWRKPAVLRALRVRKSKITSLRPHYNFCSRYHYLQAPIFLRRNLRNVLARMKRIPHDKMLLTCYDDLWRRNHSTLTGGKRAVERVQKNEELQSLRKENAGEDESSSSSASGSTSVLPHAHTTGGLGLRNRKSDFAVPKSHARPRHHKFHYEEKEASKENDTDDTSTTINASPPLHRGRIRRTRSSIVSSSVSPTTPSSSSESPDHIPIGNKKPRFRLKFVNKPRRRMKRPTRGMGSLYVGTRRKSRRIGDHHNKYDR